MEIGGSANHALHLADSLQSSIVYLFGHPNEAAVNVRSLIAATDSSDIASISQNVTINDIKRNNVNNSIYDVADIYDIINTKNVTYNSIYDDNICWNECMDSSDTANLNVAYSTVVSRSSSGNEMKCLNECIDDIIGSNNNIVCWNECIPFDTLSDSNTTTNSTKSGNIAEFSHINNSGDVTIRNDIDDSSITTDKIDSKSNELFCLEECTSFERPSIAPSQAPTVDELTVEDLWNDAISKNNTGEMDETEWNPNGWTDGMIITKSVQLYGMIFLICMILFCIVRMKFPRAYNLRSGWISEKVIESNPLAKDPKAMGFISWMWKVLLISDSELFDDCGMDALCLSRILEWGVELTLFGSIVGILLLMPVYATAGDGYKGGVEGLNTSNVPDHSSVRFLATVVAAYIIFGYVMYTTLREFEWFYDFRHQFLRKPIPRNYVVYVRHLPEEYRSRKELIKYFSHLEYPSVRRGKEERISLIQSYNELAASETKAWVSLKVPRLKELVEKRASVLSELEQNIDIQNNCGRSPTIRCKTTNRMISVVDALFEDLKDLNSEIKESVERIEYRANLEDPSEYHADDYQNPYQMNGSEDGVDSNDVLENPSDHRLLTKSESSSIVFYDTKSRDSDKLDHCKKDDSTFDSESVDRSNDAISKLKKVANDTIEIIGDKVEQVADTLEANVDKVADKAVDIFNFLTSKEEDGAPMTAGFVAFSTLKACQAAKQMAHSNEVFGIEVLEAPGFSDIFWNNVGKSHVELQLGHLLSIGLTAALCLFWTVLITFIATLSSVDGLKVVVPVIGEWLEAVPSLEPVLAQVSPIMILVADYSLKVLLEKLAKLEGFVSGVQVKISVVRKLSILRIIQTFFVNAISGSIIAQLSAIASDPKQILTLLADSLPNRSSFFIQIILADTCISLSNELLRIVPVCNACLRYFLGPKLTEKQRRTTWMGLHPFADPVEFQHVEVIPGIVFYFVVFFVYATLAPITSVFMLLCFQVMGAAYRHQLIFIYPTLPDSGGKLWIEFMNIIPASLLIGEFTIIGFLGLKSSHIALTLMFPLVGITALFNIYIRQKHFSAAEFLPGCECVDMDRKNNYNGPMDLSFISNYYMQPELRDKELYPSNASLQLQLRQGMIQHPDTIALMASC